MTSKYNTIEEAMNAEKPWRDKELMEELYLDRLMSQQEIATNFDNNITQAGVGYWLDKHNIEKRSRSEAARVRWLKELPTLRINWLGYLHWKVKFGDEWSFVSVHRLLAVSEYGFDEVKDKVVHHKNGVPWDNRPDNIELMTAAEHAVHHHHEDDGYGNAEP